MPTITLEEGHLVDLFKEKKVGQITDSWRYYEGIGKASNCARGNWSHTPESATPLGTQISLHFGQVHPLADPLHLLVAEPTIILVLHALLADVIGVDIESLKERPE